MRIMVVNGRHTGKKVFVASKEITFLLSQIAPFGHHVRGIQVYDPVGAPGVEHTLG